MIFKIPLFSPLKYKTSEFPCLCPEPAVTWSHLGHDSMTRAKNTRDACGCEVFMLCAFNTNFLTLNMPTSKLKNN